MTIVQINATCTAGSTGRICCEVSRLLDGRGVENYILHTQGGCDHPCGIEYAGYAYLKLQALRSRVTGNYGFLSQQATRRLLRELDRIRPDVVHLHNLHGHNVHLGMLMDYLRERKIKVFWTFHDSWAFTGYCPCPDAVECTAWQEECRQCPLSRRFCWVGDRSAQLFRRKHALIRNMDLTVITPSRWMAEQVRRSFFREYPCYVIRNGLDTAVFRPTESDFRVRYGLEGKKLLLGVARMWSVRKGLDVFSELAERLDDTYEIALVGVDRRTAAGLPRRIRCLPRMESPTQLAAVYTAADLFINPTRAETLGMVNLEALACGTPVVTFDTGGSPECLDETCGLVVPKNDVDALVDAIHRLTFAETCSPEACRAFAERFSAEKVFQKYLTLYGLES